MSRILCWVAFCSVIFALSPTAHAQGKKNSKKKAAAASKKTVKPVTDTATTQSHLSSPEPEAATGETMQIRGPTRLDFDDRTVQGQGSKVGAVYLYDRKNLPLRSMVHKRDEFRDQIVSDEVSGPVVE